ncbi:CBS domain-containing protein [Streptomyces sp. NPDC059525]|uniref:CBS domain-containing protein n=1 Tax=Streptomyces sp. NPDC059525 TaxID=3346857 RepID=UPI0036B997EA
MTANAVTVRPATAFKEIARLLREFDITAMPVVDETGHAVGRPWSPPRCARTEAGLAFRQRQVRR